MRRLMWTAALVGLGSGAVLLPLRLPIDDAHHASPRAPEQTGDPSPWTDPTGPVLLGRRGPSAGDGTDVRPAPPLPPSAVLRVLRGTRAPEVVWERQPLVDVAACLGRWTRLPFRATDRAQRAVPDGISVTAGDVSCEALLRSLQAKGLEWFIEDGGVTIALLGEGPTLLARELADMTLQGTGPERGLAARIIALASETLRVPFEAALSRPHGVFFVLGGDDGEPRPSSVRLDFRLLEVPPSFLRDLGVVDMDRRYQPCPLVPPGCRSGAAFLDDTQVEVLGRAVTKVEAVRELDAGRIYLWRGEERSLGLANSGVLTLRLETWADMRWVRADLRLRFLDADALVFMPPVRATIPAGGTLLLHPSDSHPADWRPARCRILLLTLDPETP